MSRDWSSEENIAGRRQKGPLRNYEHCSELIECKTWSRLPCGSDSEESACNVGDLGSIPGPGRSPGEGNGYPLQYSGLGNPIEREAWRTTISRGRKESDTIEWLTHTQNMKLRVMGYESWKVRTPCYFQMAFRIFKDYIIAWKGPSSSGVEKTK